MRRSSAVRGVRTGAVHAIEQRDPATSGHSERVATRTVALAQAVDRSDESTFRAVSFSREQIRELRYAGLLHDFGKVGVREQVLVKAKKLYDTDLGLIRERAAFLRRSAEWQFERERADYLERHGRAGTTSSSRRSPPVTGRRWPPCTASSRWC